MCNCIKTKPRKPVAKPRTKPKTTTSSNGK